MPDYFGEEVPANLCTASVPACPKDSPHRLAREIVLACWCEAGDEELARIGIDARVGIARPMQDYSHYHPASESF